jgi:DNA-binding CsgD family transcriptional regulator
MKNAPPRRKFGAFISNNKNQGVIMIENLKIFIEKGKGCQYKNKLYLYYGLFFNELTDKELMVLLFLYHELTNDFISLEMEVSVNTINKHIKNIKKKLNVKSKSELINLINARRDAYEFYQRNLIIEKLISICDD